jgi:hypothetical protein
MAIQSLKGQKHPKQIPCTLEKAGTNFCPPMIKQSHIHLYALSMFQSLRWMICKMNKNVCLMFNFVINDKDLH